MDNSKPYPDNSLNEEVYLYRNIIENYIKNKINNTCGLTDLKSSSHLSDNHSTIISTLTDRTIDILVTLKANSLFSLFLFKLIDKVIEQGTHKEINNNSTHSLYTKYNFNEIITGTYKTNTEITDQRSQIYPVEDMPKDIIKIKQNSSPLEYANTHENESSSQNICFKTKYLRFRKYNTSEVGSTNLCGTKSSGRHKYYSRISRSAALKTKYKFKKP